jgi:hypothetical protein
MRPGAIALAESVAIRPATTMGKSLSRQGDGVRFSGRMAMAEEMRSP